MRRPEIRKENSVLAVDVSIIIESGRSKISNLPFAQQKKERKKELSMKKRKLEMVSRATSRGIARTNYSLNCEIKLKFVAEICFPFIFRVNFVRNQVKIWKVRLQHENWKGWRKFEGNKHLTVTQSVIFDTFLWVTASA